MHGVMPAAKNDVVQLLACRWRMTCTIQCLPHTPPTSGSGCHVHVACHVRVKACYNTTALPQYCSSTSTTVLLQYYQQYTPSTHTPTHRVTAYRAAPGRAALRGPSAPPPMSAHALRAMMYSRSAAQTMQGRWRTSACASEGKCASTRVGFTGFDTPAGTMPGACACFIIVSSIDDAWYGRGGF